MRYSSVFAHLGMVTLVSASACKDASKSADEPDRKSSASATTRATASAEAKKSPVADFFSGPPPEGVKLTKGYTAYDPKYTMTIPASWKTGGNRADEYMAMRADSTAAVFCGWGGVSVGKIKTLAKRAPAVGKDVTLEGEPELVTIGTKSKFPARAGVGTGNLFKEDGGHVYWMEVSYEDSYSGSPTTANVHCVMAVKASAGDAVIDEAKAIMRSFSPPAGKKMIEPTKLELFDEATKKK